MTEMIRPLTESEMPLSRKLIDFAFRREGPREEPLVICRPEEVWGYFVDGELASNIVVVNLDVLIHGQPHGMGLIAGVATWPEHRKSGHIRQLMLRGLSAMRERGQTVSYLGPFHYPFYRKFGYEMMYEYRSYTLKAACVPDWRGKGRVRRIEPDAAVLGELYEAYAKMYNGMLRRDEYRWNHVVFKRRPGTVAVYDDEAGKPRGYMIYQLAAGQFKVLEWVTLDRDALYGFWEFIRKHEGAFESVAWTAPADDPTAVILVNPKGLEIKCVPHLMARIVDVAAFVGMYKFGEEGRAALGGRALYWHVEDEAAPWNEGTYRITVGEDGFGRAEKLEPAPDQCRGDEGSPIAVRCDIRTLSTMLMGYQRPSFLREWERLDASEEAVGLLERLVPRTTPYYNDFGY